jgi:hypothetical protein
MTLPIIAPIGAVSAAYALGEERGRESFAPMLIGDPIPPIHTGLLRAHYGDITETLMAAYRDGHHSGRKQAGAA